MFSTSGITPIILSLGCIVEIAENAPNTAAAPLISAFISDIFEEGLIEIPPESKVTPFPTSAIGFLDPPPR